MSVRQCISRLVIACAMTAASASSAVAQTVDWQWSQTLSYVRGPATSNSGIVERSQLEWTPISITEASGSVEFASGAELTFGARFAGILHPFTVTRTEHRTEFDVGYTRAFGHNNKWRIRLAGDADFAGNIRRWGFNRQRLGAKLQYRWNPEHTFVGGIRIGQRDQNEFTFEGFDQTELLAEFTHAWRPYRDQRSLRSTLYGEARRAESDQYSYDEIGLRFAGRYPVSDDTNVTARLNLYQREYHDSFGQGIDTIREDFRFRTTVEVNHAFSGDVNGQFFIGWDQNDANIVDPDTSIELRSFDGVVLGAKVVLTLD